MVQTYTPQQVADAMRSAGFPDSSIATGVAVATAESGRRTVQSNIVTDGKREGSYGVWQINDFWLGANSLMAPLSLGCTYDLTCSTKAAYMISRGGTDWSAWSAFTSGRYVNFLNLVPSGGPPSPTPQPSASSQSAAPAAGSPQMGPPSPTVAQRLSGSSFFSTPVVGGLLQVSTKAVISVGVIALIFVGMVKLVGGDPVKVAKGATVAAK